MSNFSSRERLMLTSLPDLSTTLVRLKQRVEGFLAGKITDVQNIPGSGTVQITNWVFSFDMSSCGQIALFNNTSNFNPTTGVYTVPVDGYYIIGAVIGCDIDSGSSHTVEGRINITTSSSSFNISDKQRLGSVGGDYVVTPTRVVQLTAGDTLTISIHITPAIDGIVKQCWWGVFLKEKVGGLRSVNSPGVHPVSKVLTNYARSPIGFSARFPSTVLMINNEETLTGWDVSSKGRWTSGQFNPTTGTFTVPQRGFYHISFSINLEFGTTNIAPTAWISTGESCMILPLAVFSTDVPQPVSFSSPIILIFLNKGEILNFKVSALPIAIYNVPTTAEWAMSFHQEG